MSRMCRALFSTLETLLTPLKIKSGLPYLQGNPLLKFTFFINLHLQQQPSVL